MAKDGEKDYNPQAEAILVYYPEILVEGWAFKPSNKEYRSLPKKLESQPLLMIRGVARLNVEEAISSRTFYFC